MTPLVVLELPLKIDPEVKIDRSNAILIFTKLNSNRTLEETTVYGTMVKQLSLAFRRQSFFSGILSNYG